MDEEDLAEIRADQHLVSEHDQMDILGGTQAERARKTGVDDSQKECVDPHLLRVAFGSPWATSQLSHSRARSGHVTSTQGFGGWTYSQEDGVETRSGGWPEGDVATTRDSAWT